MTADATTARTIVRNIANAENTIRNTIARLADELETMQRGLDDGHRLNNIGGQRITDLDRAITQRQAAWDMVVVLGLDEEVIANAVANA